eukprot:jgi/Chlat1/5247/Chrsp33S00385
MTDGEYEAAPARQRRQWVRGMEDACLRELAGEPAAAQSTSEEGYSQSSGRRYGSRSVAAARGTFATRQTSSKPDHDDELEAREQGFNVLLSGANEERVRAQRQRELARKRQPGLPENSRLTGRRNWTKDSAQVSIRTSDGHALLLKTGTRSSLEDLSTLPEDDSSGTVLLAQQEQGLFRSQETSTFNKLVAGGADVELRGEANTHPLAGLMGSVSCSPSTDSGLEQIGDYDEDLFEHDDHEEASVLTGDALFADLQEPHKGHYGDPDLQHSRLSSRGSMTSRPQSSSPEPDAETATVPMKSSAFALTPKDINALRVSMKGMHLSSAASGSGRSRSFRLAKEAKEPVDEVPEEVDVLPSAVLPTGIPYVPSLEQQRTLRSETDDAAEASPSAAGGRSARRSTNTRLESARRRTAAPSEDSQAMAAVLHAVAMENQRHAQLLSSSSFTAREPVSAVGDASSLPVSYRRSISHPGPVDVPMDKVSLSPHDAPAVTASIVGASSLAAGSKRQRVTGNQGSSASQTLGSSLKPDVPIIDKLNQHMEQLEPREQQYLLKVLEKVHKAQQEGISVDRLFASLENISGQQPSTKSNQSIPHATAGHKLVQQFTLRLLSTYGSTELIGLTEVDFYDANGKVKVLPENIALHGRPTLDNSLTRLVNGRARTQNERNMWVDTLPDPGQPPLDLVFTVISETPIVKILVWNYNKGLRENAIGVKEMQVYCGPDLVWQGVISKGCGNSVLDYYTTILLVDDVASRSPTPANEFYFPTKWPAEQNGAPPVPEPLSMPPPVLPFSSAEVPASLGTTDDSSSKSSSAANVTMLGSSLFGLPQQFSFFSLADDAQSKQTQAVPAALDVSRVSTPLFASSSVQHPTQTARDTSLWLPGVQRPSHQAFNAIAPSPNILTSELLEQVVGSVPNAASSSRPARRHSDEVADRGSTVAADQVASQGLASILPAAPQVRRRRSVGIAAQPALSTLLQSEASAVTTEPSRAVNQSALKQFSASLRSVSMPSGSPRKQSGIGLASAHAPSPFALPVRAGSPVGGLVLGTSRANVSLLPQPLSRIHSVELPATASAAISTTSGAVDDDMSPPVVTRQPRRQRQNRSPLDDSLDSLAYFQMKHLGRVQPNLRDPTLTTAPNPSHDKLLGSPESQTSSAASPVAHRGDPSDSPKDRSQLWAKLALKGDMSVTASSISSSLALQAAKQGTLPSALDSSANFAGFDIPVSPATTQPVFAIPTLPAGRSLVINILTTWGDPHYVGLAGLEMFDGNGELVTISSVARQVRANPSSVNDLPEYGSDPRTIDKLVDGVNQTCDDLHVWLAPYTAGSPHYIFIDLDHFTTLGMLRFWNYNKSRIHSYRGAKTIEVRLDSQLIFYGDIQKAPGNDLDAPHYAESILFTTDEAVLAKVEEYDKRYAREAATASVEDTNPSKRPLTSGRMLTQPSVNNLREDDLAFEVGLAGAGRELGLDGRPVTAASQLEEVDCPATPMRPSPPRDSLRLAPAAALPPKPSVYPRGRLLRLDLVSTWGDRHYMGLTAIQVLDPAMLPIPVSVSSLDARPRDLNDIPGYSGDDRTLDKLVDGCNVTQDDHHMWLIPFHKTGPHYLTIDLGQATDIGGIRVWNYNKSEEDTFRGVYRVFISLDGTSLSPPAGHILRKAPGTDTYDFGQLLRLYSPGSEPALAALRAQNERLLHIEEALQRRNHNELLQQDYETSLLPSGCTIRLLLLSTWGDPWYMGLNGLELYDAWGRRILVGRKNIAAHLESVNVLPDVEGDVRTVDKLLDKTNNTWDETHMWLTTFTPGKANWINLFFDEPVTISLIKLWNYSKTPSRGVQEMEVLVDNLLVYKGFLRKAPARDPSLPPHAFPPDFTQSIVFTNDEAVVAAEKQHVYRFCDADQSVLLVNENRFEGSAKPASHLPHGPRPATAVSSAAEPQHR